MPPNDIYELIEKFEFSDIDNGSIKFVVDFF